MATPVKLTLYDPKTQEPVKEYSQSLITFDMLIAASQLNELIENPPDAKRQWWWIWIPWLRRSESEEEKQIVAVMELVVDFFGKQFTVEQLRKGSDVGEVFAVLRAIVGRASGIMQANPTPPLPRNRKRR